MDKKDEELADLIARCALNDQKSLKELYSRCSGFLNGIAYRILGSDELSNEVLQDAFVQIWTNASTYRPHLSKPLTWMASIVRYRALDRLRSEAKHRQRVANQEEEEHILENVGSKECPQGDVESEQRRAIIYQCLAALNDKVARCVELAYLYGYSREELAQDLDANLNTVKSWLRRGSERLKVCLESKIETAN